MKIVVTFSLLFACNVVVLGSESDLYPRQLSKLGRASTDSFYMSQDFDQNRLEFQIKTLAEKNKELESTVHILQKEISAKDDIAIARNDQRKLLCTTIHSQQIIIKSLVVALPVVAVAAYFLGKKYK